MEADEASSAKAMEKASRSAAVIAGAFSINSVTLWQAAVDKCGASAGRRCSLHPARRHTEIGEFPLNLGAGSSANECQDLAWFAQSRQGPAGVQDLA